MGEIRGDGLFPDALFDFFFVPEASFVHFIVVDVDFIVAGADERKYQFFLPGTFPKVASDESGFEIRDAQFFPGFPFQCVFDFFVQSDVSAHCGVPFSRQQVFFHASFLQENVMPVVEDVQVHHGVQEFGARMAEAARCLTDDFAFFVDNRQPFFFSHFVQHPALAEEERCEKESQQDIEQIVADKSGCGFRYESQGVISEQDMGGHDKEQGFQASAHALQFLFRQADVFPVSCRQACRHVYPGEGEYPQQYAHARFNDCRLVSAYGGVARKQGDDAGQAEKQRRPQNGAVVPLFPEPGVGKFDDAGQQGDSGTDDGTEAFVRDEINGDEQQGRQQAFEVTGHRRWFTRKVVHIGIKKPFEMLQTVFCG